MKNIITCQVISLLLMLYLFLGCLFVLAAHGYNVAISTALSNATTTNFNSSGPTSLYNGGPNCHIYYDSNAGYSLYYNSPVELGCTSCGQQQNLPRCETHWLYTGSLDEGIIVTAESQMPSYLANNIKPVVTSPSMDVSIDCPDNGNICVSWVQEMTSFHVNLDSFGDGCDIYAGSHQVWAPMPNGYWQYKVTSPNNGGPPPVTPPSGPSCYSGYYGSGNGQGSAGDCCQTSNDCRDTCNNGMCDGSNGTPAPRCAGGSSGTGNGDGSTGACCVTSNDCVDTCTNGVCGNGDGSNTCSGGNPGANNGNGGTGACCTTSNDCQDTCTNGMCGNGGITTTQAKTTIAKSTTTASSCSCTSGYSGKGNGGGPTGACCSTSNDCVDTCNNGICGISGATCISATSTKTTAKSTTITITTTSSTLSSTTSTPTPMPTSITGCLSLTSLGKELQDGVTGTCCFTDLDCNLDNVCIDGVCSVYYYDPEIGDDCTNCQNECSITTSYAYTSTYIDTTTSILNTATSSSPEPTFSLSPDPPILPLPFCFLCFLGTGNNQGPVGVLCGNDDDCISNGCNDNGFCDGVAIIATNVTTSIGTTISGTPTYITTAIPTNITTTITNNPVSTTNPSITTILVNTTTIIPINITTVIATASPTNVTTIINGTPTNMVKTITTNITETITRTTLVAPTNITSVVSTPTSIANGTTTYFVNATTTEFYGITVYVNATATTAALPSCVSVLYGVGPAC